MFDRLKQFFSPPLTSLNTIYISQERILANVHYLQWLKPDHQVFPVLKSNAYGHGLKQMCQILEKTDVPFLCVDSYPEWQFVQKYTTKKALILGETSPENYRWYDTKRASIAVYNITVLKALIEQGKKYSIHLFLNTGMNREGIQFHELDVVLKLLKQQSVLNLEWVMSHLANADELNHSFCKTQVAQFTRMYELILEAGFDPARRHIGNSAGMSRIYDPLFNAWRTGLATYGYNPLLAEDPQHEKYTALEPALRITTTVVSLQDLRPGDMVSYGWHFKADTASKTATIPFGYHEWLSRKLTNNWSVKWKDQYLPLVGAICMNLSCLDTLGHDVQVGDEIEIISRDKNVPHTIQAFADKTGTISYEVLVNLDWKAKRVIVDSLQPSVASQQ